MTTVITVTLKLRQATAAEQSAIDTKAALETRKDKLKALRTKLSNTKTSIGKKVSDIEEAPYELKGDAFVKHHDAIKAQLSEGSRSLASQINKGIEALDTEIAKVEGEISDIAIPLFYPDIKKD